MKFDPIQDEVLDRARKLAMKLGHDKITNLHLTSALISDDKGIFYEAISKVSGEGSPSAVDRVLNRELKMLPSKSTAPDEVYFSHLLIPIIDGALVNAHLAVDRLILGILGDSLIVSLLEETGVLVSRVTNEVLILSGSEVKRVKAADSGNSNFRALTTYGKDLLEEAEKFAPVIGRDDEINQVLLHLSKETKGNVILVGEPGVGKTCIAEAIAQRMVKGDVPECIANARFFSLDVAALLGNTEYRGQFERRFQNILKETEDGKTILFIDEIHLLMGAGKVEDSTVDAANLFKTVLARGNISCIGATTNEEYRKYVEKDAAFERRFRKILVTEPTVSETADILRGLREKFEGVYSVRILDRALVDAATLSNRYITGRHLPDKAVDLVVEACVNVKFQYLTQPEEIDKLQRKIRQLDSQLYGLQKLNDEDSKARIVVLHKEIGDLSQKLQPMKKQHAKDKEAIDEIRRLQQKRENLIFALKEAEKQSNTVKVADLQPRLENVETAIKKVKGSIDGHVYEILTGTVGPNQIAKIVSRWTGIPVTRLSQNEKTSLVGLRDRLHNRVFGQDQAVAAVANAVLRSRGGLGATEQPNGSFLFLGPTGVGKTELAKALAEQLFDNENCLIRFNMSEYIEQNSVARLIGAPGYSGHMEAGQLTEAVRRKPYSVVLFDEIEKANKSILNLLLQVLDDGHLTDAQGLTVDFRNTVIIMTSNLGADAMLSGFLEKCTMNQADNQVMQKVKEHFSPELLNRVDEKIVFRHLSGEQLREVVNSQLKDVVSRCADRGIELNVTAAAIDYINAKINDPVNGARPIKRWLEKELVSWLSMMLVADEIVDNTTVDIDACPKGSGLTYRLGKNGVVDAEGVLKFD